jgi:hypothetical protein
MTDHHQEKERNMKFISGLIGLALAITGGYLLVTHAGPNAFHTGLAVFAASGGTAFFFISRAYGKRHLWLNLASGFAAGFSADMRLGFWAAIGWVLLGVLLTDIGGALLGTAFRKTAPEQPQQPGA